MPLPRRGYLTIQPRPPPPEKFQAPCRYTIAQHVGRTTTQEPSRSRCLRTLYHCRDDATQRTLCIRAQATVGTYALKRYAPLTRISLDWSTA